LAIIMAGFNDGGYRRGSGPRTVTGEGARSIRTFIPFLGVALSASAPIPLLEEDRT